jgi:hypothetical protein
VACGIPEEILALVDEGRRGIAKSPGQIDSKNWWRSSWAASTIASSKSQRNGPMMISKPLRPLSMQNAHYQAWGELIASPQIFRGEFDETQQLRLPAQSLA